MLKKRAAYCIVAVAIGIIAGYLAVMGEMENTRQQVVADRGKLAKGDVIFPIAHAVNGEEPGLIYRDRLDTTISLWGKEPRSIWLLAGRHRGTEESVAEVGRRYLLHNGIRAKDIKVLGDFPKYRSALDTTEEIGVASQIANESGVSTIIVVAEITHLAQARLVFGSYGVGVLLVSTPQKWYGRGYLLTRIGALLITMIDRRGKSLFWLRWFRGPIGRG